jgi:hypothetical protein
VLSYGYGRGDKALQECNLSTWPSLDCRKSIRPGRQTLQSGLFVEDALQAKVQSEKLIVIIERSEFI